MINEITNTAEERFHPRLTSGFVFKSVFGENPELCKDLLELTLNTRIRHIEYVQPERELAIAVKTRAGRVDVFVVDNEGNRYDVEIQAHSESNEPLRARHYQSLMDALQLRSGTKVENLRDSIVVFICDFDPLEDGLRLYDCKTVCLQTQKPVPDGRRILLLNATGGGDSISPELDAFLRLVHGEEVSGDPFVDRVNAIIESYISNPVWMEQYMTFEDELNAAKRHVERVTRREVTEQVTRDVTREVTREVTISTQAKMVRALMAKEGWDLERAMNALDLSPEERERVVATLNEKQNS